MASHFLPRAGTTGGARAASLRNGFWNSLRSQRLSVMTRFFFDFRLDETLALDDEGIELPDVEKAHREALGALADAVCDIVVEGQANQLFAIEVRDAIGPALEVTAVLCSKILRKH
jgi:uncharacterized protein DUF6894